MSCFNFACCISGVVCTVCESKWVRKRVNTEESFMEERGIECIEVLVGWDPLLVAHLPIVKH